MHNNFGEVIGNEFTGLTVQRGGIYQGQRLGKNSPDSTYIAKGLYPIVGEKPSFDAETQKLSDPIFTVKENLIEKTWNIESLAPEDVEAEQKRYKQTVGNSMLSEGQRLIHLDDIRVGVGAPVIIKDPDSFDDWMLNLFTQSDAGEFTNLPKPPSRERQLLHIAEEHISNFTINRHKDDNDKFRWKVKIKGRGIKNIGITVCDSSGNVLYDNFPFYENNDGAGLWMECPAISATDTKEDIYFRWTINKQDGSKTSYISDLFAYKATDKIVEGIVRYDKKYDL